MTRSMMARSTSSLYRRSVLAFFIMLALSVVGRTASGAPDNDSDENSSASKPLTLNVPRSFAMEPALLRALVRVERHADNRLLRVIIDSGSFYSSSDIQLDGADAPRHHPLTLRALPAGQYCIEAVLFRSSGGQQSARHPYTVVGTGEAFENTQSEACTTPAVAPVAADEGSLIPGIALGSSLR